MKHLLFAATLIAATAPVLAADVGVSVSIGQPGFYGRIDIGGYPPPQLIYQQPIIIERVAVQRAPIYLNVPPGHAKHWNQHCRHYKACGQPVYFVQNDWYQRQYIPVYQERQNYRREDYRQQYRRDYYRDHDGDRRDDHRGKQKKDKDHGKDGGDR